MSSPLNFNRLLSELHANRDKTVHKDDFYRESELCYQLISLCLELNKLFKGEYADNDYFHEKVTTISQVVLGMIHDKSIAALREEMETETEEVES